MSDSYSANPLSDYATIFGGKGMMTYEQLKARRAIAAALAGRTNPYPKTLGEGFAAAGSHFARAIEERKLEEAERRQGAYDRGVTGTGTGTASDAVKPSATQQAVAGIGGGIASGLQSAAAAPTPVPPGNLQQPQQPQQQAPIQPQQPQQAPAPGPSRLAIPQAPPTVLAGMTRAFDERGVAPEERDYYTRLAYHESKFNPNAVSSTGAEGPFQFTRGTARDYGLANRRDPYASTLAAIDLTGSNRQALTQRLGREPTPGELALAHNQGATGAGNLLSGMPAPSRNLAVNGVPAGASPQQAAMFLQNKLGFGGDPRRAVAASLTAAPSTPPAAAAGADGQAAVPQPPVRLASAGPYGAGGGTGGAGSGVVAQAPPQATPNQRVVQAPALSPAAQQPGVTPLGPMPLAPRAEDYMAGPDETKLRRGANDPYASDALRQIMLQRADEMKAQREKKYQEAKINSDNELKEWHAKAARHEAFNLANSKLQSDLATAKQALDEKVEAASIQNRLGGQDPKAWFASFREEKDEAATAARQLTDYRLALKAMQAGVISGFGANMRVDINRFKAWALDNGMSSDMASNTQLLRSATASAIGQAVRDIQGGSSTGVSNTDRALAEMASGGNPVLEPQTIRTILQHNSRKATAMLNDFEDRRDHYLGGTKAERDFQFPAAPSAPQPYIDRLLKDPGKLKQEFDDRFGEGSADLEIARAKRAARRGQ